MESSDVDGKKMVYRQKEGYLMIVWVKDHQEDEEMLKYVER